MVNRRDGENFFSNAHFYLAFVFESPYNNPREFYFLSSKSVPLSNSFFKNFRRSFRREIVNHFPDVKGIAVIKIIQNF